MSFRLTRLLLKLYPRAIRDRYGDELIELGTELKAEGDISRMGLIWDAFRGALALWPARSRRCLGACASLAIVVLAIAGTSIGSRQTRATASRLRVPSHAPNAFVAPGASCFVGAGSSCSQSPCTEFADKGSAAAAVVRLSVTAVRQRSPSARTRCIRYPRTQGGRALYVGG